MHPLSADQMTELRRQAQANGFHGMIMPIDPSSLLSLLDEVESARKFDSHLSEIISSMGRKPSAEVCNERWTGSKNRTHH